MSNSWIKALKELNSDKDTFCIPKKGTKMYNDVKIIQKKLDDKKPVKKSTEVTKKKRKPRKTLKSESEKLDSGMLEFERLFGK
jgi:hypothetical protein